MGSRLLKEFTKNYSIYYAYVFHFLCNQWDTEDVLQTAYYRAARSDYSHIPTERLKAWLLTICRNECMRVLKLRGKEANIDNIELYLDQLHYKQDDLGFFYLEVVQAAFLLIPKEIQPILKENMLYEVSLRALQRKYGIAESKLRYWKRKVINEIKKIF